MGVNCPCFSSTLARAMSERGATAHWLAKVMKTQQRQIDGWLHGVRLPATGSLDDLADALDVKFEFLILIRTMDEAPHRIAELASVAVRLGWPLPSNVSLPIPKEGAG